MAATHVPLTQLLSSNHQWAVDVKQSEPDFFAMAAQGQSPKVLWIGCSDSRVPESVITGAKPGEIFVHRNIANQFHLDDDNVLSVLAYAVDALMVEHVIIVGHTECGGARACFQAAMNSASLPEPTTPLARWLTPLTKIATTLKPYATDKEAVDALVEENVRAQVENVSRVPTIVNALAAGRKVYVHGWVFDIGEGKLRDLAITTPEEHC